MTGTQVASEILSGNARFLFVQMQIEQSNQVVISPEKTVKDLPRRTLDLSNIQTQELKLLSPLRSEIAPRGISRARALLSYSERLRNSYKANEGGIRDGMVMLGETIRVGQTIAVSCFCRAGEMCHADVVKMAIEKVHDRLQTREVSPREPVHSISAAEQNHPNPRTQRAINEILSVSNSDLLLARLENTEGRSQSEHASYLNQHSQFTRDLYERGAMVRDGVVIVPKEHPTLTPDLNITTNEHAVNKLAEILQDSAKAKELAPALVERGKQIAGSDADRETQIKVFDWIYRSLEGKTEFREGGPDSAKQEIASERFDRTMSEIADLAKEMSQLEPSDHFISFEDHSKEKGTTLSVEEKDFENSNHTVETQSSKHTEFERIELGAIKLAQMADEMGQDELERWFQVRLPVLDQNLESGKPVNEILETYKDNIYLASVHDPSQKQAAIDDLRFASAYIQHQLKQPDSRLRHFNPRYSKYAALLEKASTRGEVLEIASKIRSDNAKVGLESTKLSSSEKADFHRPLTSKEMQFLFTEASPNHYTSDMVSTRLSYAHFGASRRNITEVLLRGEIKPGPEARQLIESLEYRMNRRNVDDALSATKHFLQSLKTPNSELRYQNDFDYSDHYRKLPPQERDFVYQQAVRQKQHLESGKHINSRSMTSPASTMKSGNGLDVIREKIVSEVAVILRHRPDAGASILAEQTNSILASHANWDQKSTDEIKEAISKVSFEFAERLDEHRSYASGRAKNSDQLNKPNGTRQTLGTAPESGQQLIHNHH